MSNKMNSKSNQKGMHTIANGAQVMFIFSLWLSMGCFGDGSGNLQLHDLTGATMGTSYFVRYTGDSVWGLQSSIDSVLLQVNQSLSTYIPDSRISRVNQSPVGGKVDGHLRVNFLKSVEINRQSGGAFDPTVGPLTEVWGFGAAKSLKLPDSSTIDSIRPYVGMAIFSLKGDSLLKVHPKARLDMSALAKGYGVDQVAEYLLGRGIQNFVVEIGGEVRAQGNKSKGNPWTVGIEKPQSGAGRIVQRTLLLSNRSMATSGNYRNFKEVWGRKIVHTLNPDTGYPIENDLLSASVLAEDCMTADAWATAFMVMGFEKARKKSGELKGIDVVFLYLDSNHDIQEYSSSGIADTSR
ncbi:MAG: FAD:protein FMN transferase [Sphingomonadales bacterium]|nr:FAD:protein FMN transferase [Sphingomonadales bacterium]